MERDVGEEGLSPADSTSNPGLGALTLLFSWMFLVTVYAFAFIGGIVTLLPSLMFSFHLDPCHLSCSHTTHHLQGMMALCSWVLPCARVGSLGSGGASSPSSAVAFSPTLRSSASWGHCWPPSECFWPSSSSFSSGPLPGCK